MKRRAFAQSFNPKTRRRVTDNRVQLLPGTTQDFVRAGQLIGSPRRAIEELVRNAVTHGCAKEVTITFGTVQSQFGGGASAAFIEVEDDGIGIDNVACRDFIGTQPCSSQAPVSVQNERHPAQIAPGSWRGESLKALAALSVDFHVETTCLNQKAQVSCPPHQHGGSNLLSAPSKPRKKFQHRMNPAIEEQNREMKSTITSRKVVRDGKTFSYHSTESTHRSGTKVQLYGLFHKHHVRLRHYQNNSVPASSDSSDHINIGHARILIQTLSLIFPTVTFKLYQTASSQAELICLRPTSLINGESFGNRLLQRALKERFLQFCRSRNMDKYTLVDVSHAEVNGVESSEFLCSTSSRSRCAAATKSQHCTRTAHESMLNVGLHEENWLISGVLLCKETDLKADEAPMNRIKQQELIFVNNRPIRNHSVLSDLIQQLCSTHSVHAHSFWSFVLRITCPMKDVDLVLDEAKSYSLVRQKDRLALNIRRAIVGALADNSLKKKGNRYNISPECTSMGYIQTETKIDETQSEKNAAYLTLQSNSLLSSSRIVSGKVKAHLHQDLIEPNISLSSPSDTCPNAETPEDCAKSKHVDDAFDDAFVLKKVILVDPPLEVDNATAKSQTNRINSTSNSAMTWTRKRLKALDMEMRSLTHSNDSVSRPIKLSKDALSKAQFIAQLDAKFIMVNMGGILCAIDQHAADERIGLERLEHALHSNTLPDIESKQQSFSLSKKKNIGMSETIKSVSLNSSGPLPISTTQLSTITKNQTELRKWKFGFEVDEKNFLVYLETVPGIYGKVATPKDFFQFVQALGNHTSDASLVKPLFVKRVLASYACRYAVMFGDVLEKNKCEDVIQELAKCDLSFICAHGRPSVVPLVDMNASFTEDEIRVRSTHEKSCLADEPNSKKYTPLRFRNRYKKV